MILFEGGATLVLMRFTTIGLVAAGLVAGALFYAFG